MGTNNVDLESRNCNAMDTNISLDVCPDAVNYSHIASVVLYSYIISDSYIVSHNCGILSYNYIVSRFIFSLHYGISNYIYRIYSYVCSIYIYSISISIYILKKMAAWRYRRLPRVRRHPRRPRRLAPAPPQEPPQPAVPPGRPVRPRRRAACIARHLWLPPAAHAPVPC